MKGAGCVVRCGQKPTPAVFAFAPPATPPLEGIFRMED